MTSTAAFVLLIAGVLAIYRECMRPGGIIPGLLGCILVLSAGYALFRFSPAPLGVALLALAALFFVAEVFSRISWLAGLVGALAFTCGAALLFPAPNRIPLTVAIPVSLGFSGITILLAYGAKRARRNKWSDVTPQK